MRYNKYDRESANSVCPCYDINDNAITWATL